jgi:hypothetical protein
MAESDQLWRWSVWSSSHPTQAAVGMAFSLGRAGPRRCGKNEGGAASLVLPTRIQSWGAPGRSMVVAMVRSAKGNLTEATSAGSSCMSAAIRLQEILCPPCFQSPVWHFRLQ